MRKKPKSDFHSVSRVAESEPETQGLAGLKDFPLRTQLWLHKTPNHMPGIVMDIHMLETIACCFHPPNMHSFSMC